MNGPAGEDRRSQRRARPAAREVERYARLFAARTRGMRSSAMRDLMSYTERPDVISLAGGLPDTASFDPEKYAALMATVARESSARALQYGPTDGLAVMKDCVAEVMAAEGTAVDTDDVIVTTGGQQVIDLVCKTFIDPGDVIVAEAPTYPGALPTFSAYQAEVVQIATDQDGMRIELLEEALAALEAAGRRPKLIYTVPTFQNPAGVTMSHERRRRLVEIARSHELFILEDNPYGLLRYEGDPLPSLYSIDAATGPGGASDFVIYLGTFSKILSPGVRLGWSVAPRPVLEKMNLGKQGADLCSSSVTQLFVATYFRDDDWRGYVETLKAVYRRRRDEMLDALAEHFGPEAHWTHPQGGMFIWLTLPDYIDTGDLLPAALESERVAFVPGGAAYADGGGRSSMRLNFSGVNEAAIREGVRRIAKVVDARVSLYGTLTGTRGDGGTQRAGGGGRRAGEDGAPAADGSLAEVVTLSSRARPTKRARREER